MEMLKCLEPIQAKSGRSAAGKGARSCESIKHRSCARTRQRKLRHRVCMCRSIVFLFFAALSQKSKERYIQWVVCLRCAGVKLPWHRFASFLLGIYAGFSLSQRSRVSPPSQPVTMRRKHARMSVKAWARLGWENLSPQCKNSSGLGSSGLKFGPGELQ
jgi:hypothetical protein